MLSEFHVMLWAKRDRVLHQAKRVSRDASGLASFARYIRLIEFHVTLQAKHVACDASD
jgi:hypothetical protein